MIRERERDNEPPLLLERPWSSIFVDVCPFWLGVCSSLWQAFSVSHTNRLCLFLQSPTEKKPFMTKKYTIFKHMYNNVDYNIIFKHIFKHIYNNVDYNIIISFLQYFLIKDWRSSLLGSKIRSIPNGKKLCILKYSQLHLHFDLKRLSQDHFSKIQNSRDFNERKHSICRIIENLKENIGIAPHLKGVQFFLISQNVNNFNTSERPWILSQEGMWQPWDYRIQGDPNFFLQNMRTLSNCKCHDNF